MNIKFMRYTAHGPEYVLHDIPQEYIDKYHTCDTSSIPKRVRLWENTKMKNKWGKHLVGKLLTDKDFINNSLMSNPTAHKWLHVSLNNYTTNLYVFFTNGDSVGTPDKVAINPLVKAHTQPVVNPMNIKLTEREQRMLRVIEGVVDGFIDAKLEKEFGDTIHVIDEALAEAGIERTDKDKKVEADSEDSLD